MRDDRGWRIRRFTPMVDVELCGHATLASAFVVLSHLEPGAPPLDREGCLGSEEVERPARARALSDVLDDHRPAMDEIRVSRPFPDERIG